jgi:N-methylhydantoinase A
VRTTAAEVASIFAELEERARAEFALQGLGEEPTIRRLAAMRYQGQNYEQEVPFHDGEIDGGALQDAYDRYGQLYSEFYGYRLDGIPIELVRLAVIATSEAPDYARLPGVPDADEGESSSRDVYFPDGGFVPAAIVRREALAPGATLPGPAIIEFMDSTTVVPPGWTLGTREDGILEVTR